MTLDLTALRRDIHRHPETGFDLERTPRIVAEILENAGLEVVRDIGRTGIVATLRRGSNNKAIGLRADMDALPITEANTFEYRSTIEGKFHGCGHDGHTTMLLGAALELASVASFDHTIHFIFQPDEENGGGAAAMIEDGLFDRFPMKAIYGLHNMPGMPIGHFATQSGPFCAFEDNFEIRITGKGGHSSMPENGIDPIVLGASIVSQLQTIVSRSIPAKNHCVVSITGFETDGARNILASEVKLSGDCRGFSKKTSSQIETRMRAIVQGLADSQGAAAVVEYSTSFQPLVNDTNSTATATTAAAKVGKVEAEYGTVGFSEDFAEYLLHCPGAFILMGNGTRGANAMPLHNPGYDFNDNAMQHGIAYWKALAISA